MSGDLHKGFPLATVSATVLAAACGALLLLTMFTATGVATGGSSGLPGFAGASAAASVGEPPDGTLADVPPLYLSLYLAAARAYGLDWAVLAAVGKVECDHGRDPDPSCTREGSVNGAGAGGPAQFLEGTWRSYGVDANGDGVADRWDPADAIFSMANYLRASGAPRDYRSALYAYNHAGWYVARVLHWAAVYRAAAARVVAGSGGASKGKPSAAAVGGAVSLGWVGGVAMQTIPGTRAVLSPRDGHVALVPSDVPPAVQAMLIAGNELQSLPYGPDGHPDPRGASSEDCSSTINYVLYRSGVRPIEEIVRENPLAQDYVRWGAPGPGRWVSIYSTTVPTDHVFMTIAGLRLDTSHDGTDVGPNRGEDGPRWRLLDRTPTWAHWTVRHPPGL